MGRPSMPGFLTEIVAEPRARAALLAGSVALFAAGLDPRVWSASLPSVQAAIRLEPELEAIILLAAVVEAGLLLMGGAVGDSARARPIVIGGLVVELSTALVSVVVVDGPFFVLMRIIGLAAAAFIIPVALATVATSYSGTARATAIGFAYGAYGAAIALGPLLLETVTDAEWPAFVIAAIGCGVAVAICRRWLPELERPTVVERPYVFSTALWGLGIVTITTGVVWLGSGWDNPIRWALILGGGVVLVAARIRERRQRGPAGLRVDRRPVAAAIFVGLVLALAQTVPLVELPLFFDLVLQYGPLGSILALAPLFLALIAAGPIAGLLLARFSPRTLVGAGVVAVGLGDLVLATVVGRDASYLRFIAPCVLVGAGFVIATTVRTAIIFASVPRGLPATAAALNEASLAVGTRIGIVLASAVVARTAVSAYSSSLAGNPAQLVDQAVEQFRSLVTSLQTVPFGEVASAVHPGDVGPYVDAYDAGVQLALVFGALVAIGAGILAWVLLGRHDPLATVWEHQDERLGAAPQTRS